MAPHRDHDQTKQTHVDGAGLSTSQKLAVGFWIGLSLIPFGIVAALLLVALPRLRGMPFVVYLTLGLGSFIVALLGCACLCLAYVRFKMAQDAQRPHLHCGVCGYDLSGITSRVCPECGAQDSGRSRWIPPVERFTERHRRSLRILGLVLWSAGVTIWLCFNPWGWFEWTVFILLCAGFCRLLVSLVLSRRARRAVTPGESPAQDTAEAN